MLLHIVRYKFLAFLKTTFDFRPVAVIRGLGSLVVFGGFAVGAYLLTHEITRFVLAETRTGLFLFHRFISMMLFVFFVSVNLGNIIVSYATLYRSPEVLYLLTKPVPYTTLFVQKFLDNFLYSSTTLFLAAFTVLLGYGTYLGYSWYEILSLLLFLLIPLMFLSACVAVLVLMGIMRIAGRWGFRRVMVGLAGLYLVFIYLFFKYSNPIKLVEEVGEYYPNVNLYLAQLDPSFAKFLPNHWVAEALFFLSKGDLLQAIPFAALLLAVTAGMFVLVLIVADRYYYRSWLVAFQAQTSRPVRRDRAAYRWTDLRRPSWFRPQTEVLLKKEFLQFFREPSQWIHLGVMGVLIVVFVSSIRGLDFLLKVPDLPMYTYITLFGFSGFLSASLALRFVFPMISLEGLSFWTLLSMPVKRSTVYRVKFLIGAVLVVVLALVVASFSNAPFVRMSGGKAAFLWFGLPTTLVLSLTMVTVNLGLGAYFVNYQEKNPIRIASSQGATLSFLVNLFFLIVTIGLFVLPLTRYFEAWLLNRPIPQDLSALFAVTGVVFAALAVVLTLFATLAGLRSLRRDF